MTTKTAIHHVVESIRAFQLAKVLDSEFTSDAYHYLQYADWQLKVAYYEKSPHLRLACLRCAERCVEEAIKAGAQS